MEASDEVQIERRTMRSILVVALSMGLGMVGLGIVGMVKRKA